MLEALISPELALRLKSFVEFEDVHEYQLQVDL
jgi:hypothetical protein